MNKLQYFITSSDRFPDITLKYNGAEILCPPSKYKGAEILCPPLNYKSAEIMHSFLTCKDTKINTLPQKFIITV